MAGVFKVKPPAVTIGDAGKAESFTALIEQSLDYPDIRLRQGYELRDVAVHNIRRDKYDSSFAAILRGPDCNQANQALVRVEDRAALNKPPIVR